MRAHPIVGGIAGGVLALGAAGLAVPGAEAGMPAEHPSAAAAKGKPVKLTSRTVVIGRATVRKYLVGVTKDGVTFKFKRAAGPLKRLRAGKVMLLKGSDVVKVKKVSRAKGRLIVTTQPAKITDVIRSGKISFRGKPDLAKAFVAPLVSVPGKAKAARRFVRPGYPYVSGPARARVADAGTTLSIQGSKDPFGYSLGFTRASPTRMNISGTLCFHIGGICSNGPSNGVSAEVTVDGFVDSGAQSLGITVDGGKVTGSSLAIDKLAARAKVRYTISRGQGDAGQSPPVFRVPLGIDYPVIGPYGVPLYFKLQTALLLKLGVSSKNSVIRGGADVSTSGNDSISFDGKSASSAASGEKGSAAVVEGNSITLASSGTVVAVQFPKISAGLGIRAANGTGYIDVVTSIGQTTGSAIALQRCSSYDLFFTVGGGFEAQLGPLALATPKKTLYEKQSHVAQPGCG